MSDQPEHLENEPPFVKVMGNQLEAINALVPFDEEHPPTEEESHKRLAEVYAEMGFGYDRAEVEELCHMLAGDVISDMRDTIRAKIITSGGERPDAEFVGQVTLAHIAAGMEAVAVAAYLVGKQDNNEGKGQASE